MLAQRSAILWRGKCQEKEILNLRNMARVHRAERLLVHCNAERGLSWGSWVRISRGPVTSKKIGKASPSQKRKSQIALSGTCRTACDIIVVIISILLLFLALMGMPDIA